MQFIEFIRYFLVSLVLGFAMHSLILKANDGTTATLSLKHTDGASLSKKLPAIAKEANHSELARQKNLCSTECVTPFGTLLGEVDGVKSYSNCQSSCVKPEYSFLNLTNKEIVQASENPDKEKFHYIGVIHQCVEYARKWWMINKGITFGSIESAYEIIYLQQGKDIQSNQYFPLARSTNGSARLAPKRGDLIIYSADRSKPNWKHGHVAVVLAVDLQAGTVSIAEENYNNRQWEKTNQFARKLKLSKSSQGYTVTDRDIHQKDPSQLGVISGWLYPLEPRMSETKSATIN